MMIIGHPHNIWLNAEKKSPKKFESIRKNFDSRTLNKT